MSIYETLVNYNKTNRYPMHMPGHKRSSQFTMCNPYEIDVTEVEGTDNLHRPTGMIGERMQWLTSFYKTEKTYMLINGSTCGILAAISSCCQRGDFILMDRNCHKSVYNAVYLLDLKPIYLIPKQDKKTGIALGITVEQVKAALEAGKVSCVILTSPTYEGVISPIKEIADAVHEKNTPLIVDAAHGAHFGWSEKLPDTPMEQGADLVVESIHKTLPAFTQTALLHLCTKRIKPEVVQRYLGIYQTSSPSYILLAGIDKCMDWLEKNAKEAVRDWEENLKVFHQNAKKWNVLSLWEQKEKDPSKLVIVSNHSELSGSKLAELLRQDYNIETEMAAGNYVLAMTSFCDTKEGFWRLAEALTKIDKEFSVKETKENVLLLRDWEPIYCIGSYEAMNGNCEEILLAESEGEIVAEYAYIYPPGIPFLVPGEKMTKEVIEYITMAKEKELELMGLADEMAERIRVYRNGGK